MTSLFSTRQWVPFPVELVFAFFANPANLPRLMPERMKARIESVDFQAPPPRPPAPEALRRFRSIAAGAGSEVWVNFRPVPWVPLRLSWTAKITEFAWNSHFCDTQVRGPFALFQHRHGIAARTMDRVQGTLVSDEIEFALPFGAIGRAMVPIARWELGRVFRHRQERLPELLAAAAEQAARRA